MLSQRFIRLRTSRGQIWLARSPKSRLLFLFLSSITKCAFLLCYIIIVAQICRSDIACCSPKQLSTDQCLVFKVTKGSVLEVRKNRILCTLLSSDLADCVTDQQCIKLNSPGKTDFWQPQKERDKTHNSRYVLILHMVQTLLSVLSCLICSLAAYFR